MKKLLPIAVIVFAALAGCTQGPPPPELIFPDNGYELTTWPFSWSSVAEADEYQFQISKDESFYDVVINEVTTDTFYSVASQYAVFEDGTTYYWRVLSGNADGWGKSSEVRSFGVRML